MSVETKKGGKAPTLRQEVDPSESSKRRWRPSETYNGENAAGATSPYQLGGAQGREAVRRAEESKNRE